MTVTETLLHKTGKKNELSVGKPKASTKEKLIFGILLAIALIAYHLIYANKAMPYAEGWHAYYAELIKAGNVPYRDFFYFLPPLNLVIDFTFWGLSFGSMLAFRLWRLAERIAMIEVLFLMLSRYFSPKLVALGCFFGCIIGGGSPYDLLGDYNQTAEFLLILTAFCSLRFAEETDQKKKYVKMAIAGLMIGLTFMCKQSTGGIAMIVYVIFLITWCIFQRDKKFWWYALSALVGIATPVVFAAAILGVFGALPSAIEQIFFGAGSKGGLGTMLFVNVFSFYRSVITTHWPLISALTFAGVAVFGGNYFLLRKERPKKMPELQRKRFFFILCALSVVAIVIALIVSIDMKEWFPHLGGGKAPEIEDLRDWFTLHRSAFFDIKNTFVQLLVLGLTGVMVYGIGASLIRRKPMLPMHIIVLTVGAYASLYSVYMSFGVDANDLPMRTMYFTFTLMFCILGSLFSRWKRGVLLGVIICFSVISCLYTLGDKLERPYNWWGYVEAPVYEKTHAANVPGLEGYRFSRQEKKNYEALYKLVEKNTDEDDVVFGYPYIKIFNLLTDHIGEPGFVPVHFFDVCPDNFASEDAELIKENPPDIILWQDLGTECWDTHEDYFREGARMGQRDFQAWFVSVKNEKYELIGQVGEVYVYKLKDNGTPTRFTYFEKGTGDRGNVTATPKACRPR